MTSDKDDDAALHAFLRQELAQNHWIRHYAKLERDVWEKHTKSLQTTTVPTTIGANGQKRARDEPEEPGRDRRRVLQKRAPVPWSEVGSAAQTIRNLELLLEQVATGQEPEIMLHVFLPTPDDFPALSDFVGIPTTPITYFGPSPLLAERARAKARRLRSWRWNSVADAALVFAWFSRPLEPSQKEEEEGEEEQKEKGEGEAEGTSRFGEDVRTRRRMRIARALHDHTFVSGIWRAWLDGHGAKNKAGRCTETAVREPEPDPKTGRYPRIWYTGGFLASVVLHRALYNSAHNVLDARDVVSGLTRFVHDDENRETMTEQERTRYLLTVRTPGWINRWMTGRLETPKIWRRITTSYRLPNAWFAPQLSFGFLYLDFVAPHKATRIMRAREGSGISIPDDGFVPKRGLRHLQLMHTLAEKHGNHVPMVVRVPALTLGGVLGAGKQMTWGYTPARARNSWVRMPARDTDDPTDTPARTFDPLAVRPFLTSGAFVVAGIPAAHSFTDPPIGLVVPDDPPPKFLEPPPSSILEAEEEGTVVEISEELLVKDDPEAMDDYELEWFEHVNDVWLANVRLDSPITTLALLAKVGMRWTPTIDGAAAIPLRTYERRLGAQDVDEDMLRPQGGRGRDPPEYPYLDGKNVILSHCWMPQPHDSWVRGRRILDEAFWDPRRGIWIMDVGDSTAYVQVLQIVRCHGGPALPTVVPDLRMRHLTYAVPVYPSETDPTQEDTKLIANHGRIDRILLLPATSFIFDRVAFSREMWTNAAHWRTGVLQETDQGVRFRPGWGPLYPDFHTTEPVEIHYDLEQLENELRDRITEQQIAAVRARTTIPGQTLSHISLRGLANLVALVTRLARLPRTVIQRVQWTNILFVAEDYPGMTADPALSTPLVDWMQAMDTAMHGLVGKHVWLSLHPTLRDRLGRTVNWKRIAFRTFSTVNSEQLTVRLGITELPARADRNDPLALMDRLRTDAARNRLVGRQDIEEFAIIDLENNRIGATETTRRVMQYVNHRYRHLDRTGLMILLHGNNIHTIQQIKFLEPFRVFELRSAYELVRELRSRRGYETITLRILAIMINYRLPVNVDVTIPGDTRMLFEGPESVYRNPYGQVWVIPPDRRIDGGGGGDDDDDERGNIRVVPMQD